MPEHRITLPGTTEPEVVVETRRFGLPHVYVGGERILPESIRGRPAWPIPVGRGKTRYLLMRGMLSGLVGAVDGVPFQIEPRLALWELLLCFAPLSFSGLGLIPGVIGILLGWANLRIVRMVNGAPARIAALGGVFLGGLAVAYLVGILVGG